ncbi:MAG: hypothetical protein COB37_00540 [Kordiimonadales bacterium]|nr:MAG: hypothetical protein COB37_00540 [Kordiimonadales bacterium]
MLELLDNFFRFGGMTTAMFTGALALQKGGCTTIGRLAAFGCFSVAAYLLVSLPGVGTILGVWMIPALLICFACPPAIWLFSLSMFDDNFTFKRIHFVVGGGFFVLTLAQYFIYYATVGEVPYISPMKVHEAALGVGAATYGTGFAALVFKMGMSGHMLWSAWQGRNDDLVSERRVFRQDFVIAVALISVWLVLSPQWISGDTIGSSVLLISQSAAIFGVNIYMLWAFASMDMKWMFGDIETAVVTENTYAEGEDRHDLENLNGLVKSGKLLETGLTVTRLATFSHMPEHRLRRIVNQHLGFRNFADYLNFHRVDAAKTRLAVIEDRHVPVLTVAMDLGYGSLGPFNKAFKERTGQTPTEFRRDALALGYS